MTAASMGTVRRVGSTRLSTRWGTFEVVEFEREIVNGRRRVETALAIKQGDLSHGAPLLRNHSQCFSGEALGSLRCDCHERLEIALRSIAREGRGLVIYEYQEQGRICLTARLRARALEGVGLERTDGDPALGIETEWSGLALPAAILHTLGVRRVRLLSNNPRESPALADVGIEVIVRLPCVTEDFRSQADGWYPPADMPRSAIA
jgi:GTP cyclohydrolase II